MKNTYVAIDIGASSGRLMLSELTAQGNMTLTEIHRFKNGYIEKEGTKYWEIEKLAHEILVGLEKIKKQGINQCIVGIDTWAVDYCLIDSAGNLLQDPISYRDARTNQAIQAFNDIMSLETLYQKTGIQIQPFNTLFQLFVENRELLTKTEKILLIPDYLGYYFTGKSVLEKSNALTMQLINVETSKLDQELLEIVGVKADQFAPLVDAGTILGELRQEKFLDYELPQVTFVTVGSHDTASAVVGVPSVSQTDDWAFISSGTWSLLGKELKQPLANQATFAANYTNEGGVFGTIRFLKNIMGLWLIQEVARQDDYRYSYAELAQMASEVSFDVPEIDVNDVRFLSPSNMIEEIQSYCKEHQLAVPETPAQIALTIYENLATCYGEELKNLATLTGSQINTLHIVGGGSNAVLLNQLTANKTGVIVEAGPNEATAIGNIIMQMLTMGELNDLAQARQVIRDSFELKIYYPEKGAVK